jgi:hypothetical protein
MRQYIFLIVWNFDKLLWGNLVSHISVGSWSCAISKPFIWDIGQHFTNLGKKDPLLNNNIYVNSSIIIAQFVFLQGTMNDVWFTW